MKMWHWNKGCAVVALCLTRDIMVTCDLDFILHQIVVNGCFEHICIDYEVKTISLEITCLAIPCLLVKRLEGR